MNIRKTLAIVGAGGHASSSADAALSAGFEVAGFFGQFPPGSNSPPASLMDDISALNLQEVYLCIGVGTNFLREAIYNSIKAHFPRARLPPIVHSTAWVAHNALLGEAAVLLAHSLAGSRATVGIGALLNTGASLDHDSILGSFASLGPGARTGGSVHIGDRAMVGLQAGILQGRTVGQDTVIGAQALVNNDVPELSVAMGIPSTIVRRRERDEPYY